VASLDSAVAGGSNGRFAQVTESRRFRFVRQFGSVLTAPVAITCGVDARLDRQSQVAVLHQPVCGKS
jgi:hypothetical protein